MKVQVPQLLRAVAAIDLIPARAGISSSEFIRIQADAKSIRFSLAAEIFGVTKAKVDSDPDPAPWEFYIDRASFVPFVMSARELGQKTPFEFKHSTKGEHTLTVRCGHRKATYQTVTEVSGYSDKANFAGGALVLTREQKAILRLAVKYATQDPTVAHLNCVYLSKGKAILASNQLSAFYMEDAAAPMSVPLPLLLLSILDNDQVKGITVSPNFARVDMTCGFLCQLTNKKAAAEFPHKAINTNIKAGAASPKRFAIKAKPLLAVLKRLESYVAAVVKRDMAISVTGNQGDHRLRLTAIVPQGKFEEYVPSVFPLKEDIACEWLLGLLLPLADLGDALGTLTVRYGEATPFHFTGKGLQLLVARKS